MTWNAHLAQPCLGAVSDVVHLRHCQPLLNRSSALIPSASRRRLNTECFAASSSGQRGPQIAADFSDRVGEILLSTRLFLKL